MIGAALFEQPISRRLRRVSLVHPPSSTVIQLYLQPFYSGIGSFINPSLCLQSEIGFGKLETYVKLDKLGEVRTQDSETV